MGGRVRTGPHGLTWARSCFRRGEAEARITRLPRSMFSAGRSRGRGSRGRGGAWLLCCRGCEASLYEGGGSRGTFSLAMLAAGCLYCLANVRNVDLNVYFDTDSKGGMLYASLVM